MGQIVSVCCCHRSKSTVGLKERVKRNVTPIFFTAIGDGLALPHRDLNSRSKEDGPFFISAWYGMPSFGFDTDRISLWEWCRYKGGRALVFPGGRGTTAAGNVISVFWTDTYHDSAAAVRQ